MSQTLISQFQNCFTTGIIRSKIVTHLCLCKFQYYRVSYFLYVFLLQQIIMDNYSMPHGKKESAFDML